MAVSFVGKGLGVMAAVVPLGVVTPQAIVGGVSAAVTYRLLSEGGNTITTELGDNVRSEQNG